MKNIFPQNLFYCQDEEGGGGGRTAGGGGAQHKVNVAMCANRLSPSSPSSLSLAFSLTLPLYLSILLSSPPLTLSLTRCCQFARLVRRI